MKSSWVVCVLAAGTACVLASVPAAGQARESFVMLAGHDTLSVERFVRRPDRLTGEIETRVSGRTSRLTYSVLSADQGRPGRLEFALTVPQHGISSAALDLRADSAFGPVMLADKETMFRGAVTPGAVPLLYPLSIAMLEDVVRAAPRRAGVDADVPLLAWGNQTPENVARHVRRVDATTVEVAEPNGFRLTLDARGRIVGGRSLDGQISIVRIATPPVPPRAARPAWAPGDASTPPMGWNSWNRFGCKIDEALLRQTADAMVRSGMLGAGYRYLNIDDCWEARDRDAQGNLAVDSTRFPSGMKALVDYIHSTGLKVGIYSSGGTGTCQRRPASLDHEAADARLFASWGIDYLKYDNCNAQGRPEQVRYKAMMDAVVATAHPMVFSICEWGEARPWLWGRQLGGQLWRTTEDIRDSWLSMLGLLDLQVGLEDYAGPDGWNDPDMLEVGNGRMSQSEYRAHFSLWALLNAPLIAGNDIRSMDDSTRAILMNHEVIAVNQDWGGRQGFRLRDDGALELWAKPMSDGGWAVVMLNRGPTAAPMQLAMHELDAAARRLGRAAPRNRAHRVRDLWTNQSSVVSDLLRETVPAHGAVMLRIDGSIS